MASHSSIFAWETPWTEEPGGLKFMESQSWTWLRNWAHGYLTVWCQFLHGCMLSRFSCVWLLATLWTVAHQAPLSKGFSRQECWSGLPCSPPRDLSHAGIEPTSLMSAALATTSAAWEALVLVSTIQQSVSVIHIHVSTLLISFPFRYLRALSRVPCANQ